MNIAKVNSAGQLSYFLFHYVLLCKDYKDEDKKSATVKSLLCGVSLWS